MEKTNYYSVTELCRLFNVSLQTIKKRVESNVIPYQVHPVTGRKMFEKTFIDNMLKNTGSKETIDML